MKVQHIDLTKHSTTCDTCMKRIDEGFTVAAETDKESAKIVESIIKNYITLTKGRPIIIVCDECAKGFAQRGGKIRNEEQST